MDNFTRFSIRQWYGLLLHDFMMINVIIYILILCWWDVMRTRWWLRSTTGSYGRSVLEVAYGKMIIHSTEVVWEILDQEEWLGCRHDTSLMVDILGSTPMWAQYMVFFDFTNIKVYIYYVLKTYMYYERNTGGLWHCPSSTILKESFWPFMMYFNEKEIHRFIIVSLD